MLLHHIFIKRKLSIIYANIGLNGAEHYDICRNLDSNKVVGAEHRNI
jgi:hypothetical protein